MTFLDRADGIHSTIVVLGSTRIPEPMGARRSAACDPAGMALVQA